MTELTVRVYYEDTDHGGVVYHANYLKFMERARTEYLRKAGFEQSRLAAEEDVVFAVSRSDIHYIKPAFFDDLLRVGTEITEAKGARIYFKQRIYRGDEVLIEADMLVACMSRGGKPKRIPETILDALNKGKL